MKANVQKKKITGNGFLLLITIALFVVMYVAGMIVFADKGFAKPQMFLNLFVSNAGLLVIACGLTIVMITGGIDISVGSVTALVCMVLADLMENKGVNCSSFSCTAYWCCFWYCSGIPGSLSGYPAIHRYSGRYVLRTWSDSYHQY